MKNVLSILGAGALTLTLFGCSSEEESKNDVSKTSGKVVVLPNNVVLPKEESKKQLPSTELFQKTVKQATGSDFNREDMRIIYENDYAMGWLTSIDKDTSYSDEQAHKRLLNLTCELLNKNPNLDGIYLQIPQNNDHKYINVFVNKERFNQWTGFDIEDDNEWETFCGDLNRSVTEEFFHKFGTTLVLK